MTPNQQITAQDGLIYEAVERATAEVAEGATDENVSPEQLGDRAQMRFSELTMPHRMGFQDYLAETVREPLIEVASREITGVGRFSTDKVDDESMAKLERILGAPEDRDAARIEVRNYILEAHGLPRASNASLSQDS